VVSGGLGVGGNRSNRRDAVAIMLEAYHVATAVRRLMEHQAEVVTTATDLLVALNTGVSEDIKRSRDWPKAANALSGRLIRLAPALRRVGVAITFERSGESRNIRIDGTDRGMG
jgi:transposase